MGRRLRLAARRGRAQRVPAAALQRARGRPASRSASRCCTRRRPSRMPSRSCSPTAGPDRSSSSSTSSSRSATPPPRRRRRRRLPRRVPDAARLRVQRQADARPGWSVEHIADAWARLMTALGYDRFGAQGGDWGSAVTTCLGVAAPGADARHPPQHGRRRSRQGRGRAHGGRTGGAWRRSPSYREWGTGYSTQQATRPQTVGYGLVDSPAAQAAWIVEKFWAWTDHGGHPEDAITRDRLLDNVMHYWLPAAGASSARLYWESFAPARRGESTVPVGASIFPKEIIRPSRRWAERRFTDIRHWNELADRRALRRPRAAGGLRRRGPGGVPHDALIRLRPDSGRRATRIRTQTLNRREVAGRVPDAVGVEDRGEQSRRPRRPADPGRTTKASASTAHTSAPGGRTPAATFVASSRGPVEPEPTRRHDHDLGAAVGDRRPLDADRVRTRSGRARTRRPPALTRSGTQWPAVNAGSVHSSTSVGRPRRTGDGGGDGGQPAAARRRRSRPPAISVLRRRADGRHRVERPRRASSGRASARRPGTRGRPARRRPR